jgi:hypothetical protein
MSAIRMKKTAKYRRLKKQVVKLGILIQEEFEFSEDDFTRQLWDENQRLEKEVKVLKKEFNKLSFVAFIMVIILLIPNYLKQKIKKNEKKTLTNDSESLRKDEILKLNDD